jgi:O-antigen ligase
MTTSMSHHSLLPAPHSVLSSTQQSAFISLLIFSPLARGATPRWAFCVSLWLVLVAFSAMVLKRLWGNERLLPRSPVDAPVVVLVLLAIASVFVSIYRFASAWALLRLLLYVGAFYVTLDMVRSREQTRLLVFTILGVGTAIAFIGIIKYNGGIYPAFWDYGNGDIGRLNSTFFNANHAAGYLGMALGLGLALFLHRSFMNSMIWSLPFLLILVALCMTMSRGGWASTLLALDFMLVLFLLKKGVSKLKVWSMASVLLVTLSLTILASNPMIERLQSMENAREPSLTARMMVSKASSELIEEQPLLGSGLGTFPWSFTRVRPAGLHLRFREAHNDYVQVISEMGLLVLIPIAWGIYLVFRNGIRNFRETGSRFRTGTTLGALGGILAILIHSLFDFNIQITANGILFSAFIGLAIGTFGEMKGKES